MKTSFSILFIVLAIRSFGCSCSLNTLENEILASHSIFTGKVVSIVDFTYHKNGYAVNLQKANLIVSETYKGEPSMMITVYGEYSDPCGYLFQKDSSYLIFADLTTFHGVFKQERLFTHFCKRTSLASQQQNTIRQLEKVNTRINDFETISPEELYLNIWKGEHFGITETPEKLLLNTDEMKEIASEYLVPCELDSIFPSNAMDSSLLKANFWTYRQTKIFVHYTVDETGKLSNVRIKNHESNQLCSEIAINFVRRLQPWQPASIKGINVISDGVYIVDFDQVDPH